MSSTEKPENALESRSTRFPPLTWAPACPGASRPTVAAIFKYAVRRPGASGDVVLHAHKPGSPWSADRDCPPRPLPALLRRRPSPRGLRRRAVGWPRGGAHGAWRYPDDRPGRHERRTSSKRPARALLRGSPPPFGSGARSHVEREERDADARARPVRRVGAEERRQSRVRSRRGSRSTAESYRRRRPKPPGAAGVRPSNRGTRARTRYGRAAPRRTQPAPRCPCLWAAKPTPCPPARRLRGPAWRWPIGRGTRGPRGPGGRRTARPHPVSYTH